MDLLLRAHLGSDGTLSGSSLRIVGPTDRAARSPVRPGDFLAGVRFRLGWGAICLGLEAGSLRNRWVPDAPARQRLGPRTAELLAATRVEDAVIALQRLAVQLAEGIVLQAWQRQALERIESLHVAFGTYRADGSRSGRRHALALAGMPLVTLGRLLRFQHAMRLLERRPEQALADLACIVGYADQAHLCREFRRFGGFTPRRLQAVPPTWQH
ncbi:helix-turn-helix domain-containing protein [Aquabacterium sp. A7-Y]|uniref:helix-turn-helix domain-containing protein n=1 Tax=Aquabacterium sp. A7-Y TaxID=1349605 RepID=UPI00223E4A35|nr:helix-turn-helix domain-containing protein [Aquabacterium sp. A7-Y]MCW7540399.1 helix-turn-helix domain-containing protein [Aquabacterium sp. A7-Y]